MSSTPVLDPFQQQQPPPMVMAQQSTTSHSGHGSVGPVIGVLAVISVLCAIAITIGRLCSGRRIMGHGQYDFEKWAEIKCASCIDGRLTPPLPPPPLQRVVVAESTIGLGHVEPSVVQEEPPQETREEEVSDQQHHHRHHHHQHERAEP